MTTHTEEAPATDDQTDVPCYTSRDDSARCAAHKGRRLVYCALDYREHLIAAEKRADDAERLYANVANPKCLNEDCGHLWREHEASGEDCEEPCCVAGCSCDAFEGESDAARFATLTSHLAAANAKIERLKGVGSVPERVKAHQELDKCLDEAGRAEYGWLHDHDLSHQTDRIYRHVHVLAVRSFAELKSKSIAERVKRFRDTVGALYGGNRNPDRCICQTLETGQYADTPHVHHQEPPFSCGRCKCQAYVPAITSPEQGEGS